MNKKPLILITNDDGYQAKGINSLISAMKEIGEVIVVAPSGPRSGMSGAITSIEPIRYHLISKEEGVTIYACTGTPVDCVKLAVSEIMGRQPDLLVSGINHGSNASICVLYSGTMGAAMEGTIFGVPSIGFSLLDHAHDADFSHTHTITKALAQKVLATGLPKNVCLNVNIPDAKTGSKGIKVCTQAAGKFVQEFKKSTDGAEKEIFWLTGYFENEDPTNTNTDEWALAQGYTAVVPITIDMTAHTHLADMKSWENLV